jgi:thiol-disulfide isomerase/thioredoxin
VKEFYKLNADEELEELVDELEVERFPTFRVYKNGEVVNEYTGSLVEKVSVLLTSSHTVVVFNYILCH